MSKATGDIHRLEEAAHDAGLVNNAASCFLVLGVSYEI